MPKTTSLFDFEITPQTILNYFSKEEVYKMRLLLYHYCSHVTTRQVEYTVFRQGGWRLRTSDVKHYHAEEVAQLCLDRANKGKSNESWEKILYVIKEEIKKEMRCQRLTTGK